MTDQRAPHETTDIALLYALGALSQNEARSFEDHLAEGCEPCRFELESFELTVGALAYSAPDEAPPDRVRAALLTKLSNAERPTGTGDNKDREQFVSIRASEGKWREMLEGVFLKRLHVDPATRIATSLVRMSAGTSLPVHQHVGVEQFYVIEGDCNVAGQTLTAGDYHRAEAGSTHETTSTVGGTLLLLIAPERYEVLEAS
jgi:anti-sigma factor ChrR (cupin superfamily)